MFWIHVLCQLCICKYFIPVCRLYFYSINSFAQMEFLSFFIKFNFYLSWIVLLVSDIRILPNPRSQYIIVDYRYYIMLYSRSLKLIHFA